MVGAFKTSAKTRNDIVHEGRKATEDEAVKSLKACTALVEHIK